MLLISIFFYFPTFLLNFTYVHLPLASNKVFYCNIDVKRLLDKDIQYKMSW